MSLSLEIVIVLLLILINGVFAMSELALVSLRRARLSVLEKQGVRGASIALALSEDPQRFLPTVQVGITLVSVLAGVFGGSRITAHLEEWLLSIPALAPFASSLAFTGVVVLTTYLTLVIGELVPKQAALRNPERISILVAPWLQRLARVGAPVVWVLGRSSHLVLRLFGLHKEERQGVTEEELKAVLAEGAQDGVFETEERHMIERLLRLADKPVRAIMTPRNELAWIDRSDPKSDNRRRRARGPAQPARRVRWLDRQRRRRRPSQGSAGPDAERQRALDRRGAAPSAGHPGHGDGAGRARAA